MALTIIDASGKQVEVNLEGMKFYTIAAHNKISVRQAINQAFPTRAGDPDAFQQLCHNAGLQFKHDEKRGIPAANLREVLNPEAANQSGGTYTAMPAVPDSRILFPAALLEAVNSVLDTREDVATAAFESLIGYRQTIASDRFEQPVINYATKGGPNEAGWQRVAQNARPPIMLSILASDVTRTIPTTAIGMEISAKALMNNSLDLVARTMVQFTKKSDYAEWVTQMGYILSGDPDAVNTPMAACKNALAATTSASLDSACTGNALTQKCWLKWLYQNIMKMTKTSIVCDINAAMAIENRTNRPTNVMNNSTDRLDVPFKIIYPAFQKEIDILVMPPTTFTANTLMGLDKTAALAKVTSSMADYNAMEEVVMKRSTEFRFDRGFVIYRQYDEAFDVLTLS